MFLNLFLKNNKVVHSDTISKVKIVYNNYKCYVCNTNDYLKPILLDKSICFCKKCNVKVILYEYIDLITYNELIELKLKTESNKIAKTSITDFREKNRNENI